MLGGIRHFVWDTGVGMGPGTRDVIAWATLAGSLALTVIVWAIAWAVRWREPAVSGKRRAMTTTPSMRTPLSRVRYLGAAHSGTGHFWRQRLTALPTCRSPSVSSSLS